MDYFREICDVLGDIKNELVFVISSGLIFLFSIFYFEVCEYYVDIV